MRNLAIHNTLNFDDKKLLDIIYKYCYTEKKLVKIYNKILKVRERDFKNEEIKKVGKLVGKGYKLKIHGKSLYCYLIDNDEYAACDKNLQNGEYDLVGIYQNSRGRKIYNITKYQLLLKN